MQTKLYFKNSQTPVNKSDIEIVNKTRNLRNYTLKNSLTPCEDAIFGFLPGFDVMLKKVY